MGDKQWNKYNYKTNSKNRKSNIKIQIKLNHDEYDLKILSIIMMTTAVIIAHNNYQYNY